MNKFINILKSYGVFHFFWLIICYSLTKLFFPAARLIRFPIFLRGSKRIIFGPRFTCGYLVRIDAFGDFGCLKFGSNVQLNDFVHIGAFQSITIGDNVLIASKVFISDHDHGCYTGGIAESSPLTSPSLREIHCKPIVIEDNVWIGENVSILAGAQVGEGSIIGAGSVVKGIIPSHSIAVGSPARVIKRYNSSLGLWIADNQ